MLGILCLVCFLLVTRVLGIRRHAFKASFFNFNMARLCEATAGSQTREFSRLRGRNPNTIQRYIRARRNVKRKCGVQGFRLANSNTPFFIPDGYKPFLTRMPGDFEDLVNFRVLL